MLSFGGKSHWITALDRQPTQITVHISSFTFDWFIVLRCNSIIRLISAGSLEITDTFNKWCNQKWIQYELSIYKKCMIISQGSILIWFSNRTHWEYENDFLLVYSPRVVDPGVTTYFYKLTRAEAFQSNPIFLTTWQIT